MQDFALSYLISVHDMCSSFLVNKELTVLCVFLLLVTEEKAPSVESEPTFCKPMEQIERATSDPEVTASPNPKSASSSDSTYAIVIKYDDGYVKSYDGILRLFHVVGCFEWLLL